MTESMPTSDVELLEQLEPVQEPDASIRTNAPVIRVILADSQAIYRVGMRKVFAIEDECSMRSIVTYE